MIVFDTMHVFDFGQCQLISGISNKTAPSDEMATLPAFVSYAQSLCPPDVTLTPYHVINVFYGDSLRYLGSNPSPGVNDNFIVQWENLDLTIIDALAEEINNYNPS